MPALGCVIDAKRTPAWRALVARVAAGALLAMLFEPGCQCVGASSVACLSDDQCPAGSFCGANSRCGPANADTGPAISHVAVNGTVFSAIEGYNQIVVTFDTSKSVDHAPASLDVNVGTSAFSCGAWQATSPRYTCSYRVTGSEAEGSETIAIQARDAAGKSTQAQQTIALDFTPPALTSSSAAPTVAGIGAQEQLTLTPSEPLLQPPTVSTGAGAPALPFSLESGTSYVFAYTVGTGDVSAQYQSLVTMTDLVGNTAADVSGPRFTIDTTLPVLSKISTNHNVFSRVTGYNLILLTFDSSVSLDSRPANLAVSVGGRPFVCGTYQTNSPSYTCTYTVGQADAEGSATIDIVATNSSGNATTATANVTFDFTPPALVTPSASPANVGVRGTETLTFTASKPLASAPMVTAALQGGSTVLPFTSGSGPTYTYLYTVGASDVSGSYQSSVQMTDMVGNAASVKGPTFNIDTVIPTITNIAVNSAIFSAQPGFNGISVTFNTAKPMNGPGDHLQVTLGTTPMSCQGPTMATPPGYTCTYTVTGHETPGQVNINITATDEAGNTSTGQTPVTLEFAAPSIVVGPTVTYQPGNGNPLTNPTAATVGTTITVAFQTDEAEGPAPVVVTTPAGISFQHVSGTHHVFSYTWTMVTAGAPPDGTYGLKFTLTDEVGNAQTLTPASPTVVVLTKTPTAPNTAPGGPVTYVRIPWGDNATSGAPGFLVTGSAGAAPNLAQVLVFDGASPPSANLIGTGTPDRTGAFSAGLSATDRTGVWILGIDAAGNVSPTASVHNVSWTASFDGKVSGSTTANPHKLFATQDFVFTAAAPVDLGELLPSPSFTTEDASYTGVAAIDGQTISTSTSFVWQPLGNGTVSDPTSSVPSGRSMLATAYDSVRGVTVLFGGQDSTGNPLGDTWEWDGASWNEVAMTGPPPRMGHAMVFYPAIGVTVLFGGCADPVCSSQLGDTWIWDGKNWTDLTPASGGPVARGGHSLTYDPVGGAVTLFGGVGAHGALNDTWELQAFSWSQASPARSPPARAFHGATYDAARRATLVFGGESASAAALSDLWSWNGANWTQANVSGPSARIGPSMVYDPLHQVTFLFGGCCSAGPLSDLWQWNGSAWTLVTPNGTTPPARWVSSVVFDTVHAQSLLLGGCPASSPDCSSPLQDSWSWNGQAWLVAEPTVVSPSARTQTAMAYDALYQNTTLFGGTDASGNLLGDTWQWNGSLWTDATPTSASPSPQARTGHAMVYDSLRHLTYLGGGCLSGMVGGVCLRDLTTWSWNGSQWTNIPVTGGGSPLNRSNAALAFDQGHGVTVLFGGSSGGSAQNDTWTWNGASWSKASPATSPPARYGHVMVYDPSRAVTVLFGGIVAPDAQPLNDTWEWNGANWTNVTPTQGNPPARQGASAIYDVSRGLTVLYGGCTTATCTTPLSDTWIWNGSSWTSPTTDVTPPAVGNQAMAYDVSRGETVVFGGTGTSAMATGPLNETWVAPSAPSRVPAQLAAFSFAAAGATSPTITQMTFNAVAGGAGSTVANPAPGTVVSGAVLAVWDSWSGAWFPIAQNTSTPSTPSVLSFTTTSQFQAGRFLFATAGDVILALFPSAGDGNGTSPSQIAVDYVELNVQYQQ